MIKILSATCVDNKVTVAGQEIENVIILNQGTAESEGVVFIDGDTVTYIASNAGDLAITLEKLADALSKITATLTAIGGGMTGPTTAPPGTLAPNVGEIDAIASELSELKDNLT